MPFFQGSMPMYSGNMKGSFGTVGAVSGNATKAPAGRGRQGVNMGMPAKAPSRSGGSTVNPMKG